MKDRIKQLRKSLGMSQTKFGEAVGVSMSAEQKWEMGLSVPSEAAIKLICGKFSVNEAWLRTGAGPMYAERSREEEIATLVKSLMQDSPDSFRSALVTTLLRFDPDGPEWEILERVYESVAREMEQNKGGK